MSSTTHNLPYKRFVAQVSTGVPRSKSTWLALMDENLEALKACPWREAADVEVALTPHDFTLASYFLDVYDAYKMTGNYDSSKMTEIGYAGMAAYRFKVPSAATTGNVALSSIALPISRDRFLKGGVRIAAALSNTATPSAVWSVVRGDGEGALVAKEGLKQWAANLLAGTAGAETVEIDLSGLASGNPAAYLWVYVTLEDYTDHWEMYDAREKRLYAIEGSAMLVGGSAVATFAAAVAADAGPAVLLAGGSSPAWLQPLATVNVGNAAPTVSAGADQVDTFFTPAVAVRQPATAQWAIGGECAGATSGESYSFEATLTLVGGKSVSGQITCVKTTAGGQTVTFGPATMVEVSYGTTKVLSYVCPAYTTVNGTAYYFHVYLKLPFVYQDVGAEGLVQVTCESLKYFISTASAASVNAYNAGGSPGVYGSASEVLRIYVAQSVYWMLRMVGGVPDAMDACNAPSEYARQNLECSITGASPSWSATVGGRSFSIDVSGSDVTLAYVESPYTSWAFQLAESLVGQSYFDPAVNVRLGDTTVEDFGLAAAVGDFSHAVATFEAGTQPSHAEVLARLARMSRKDVDAMMYLHPASGALASELDVLRPVPRFFRAATSPTGQTACQPGLSAWYWRPGASTAALSIVQREGPGKESVVGNPAFLQLALIALRAPSAFGRRIVLKNTSGAAVSNGFALRFVAWRSKAELWDGANAYAQAAMAGLPSVYRSDGSESVQWRVDCSGALMPSGLRVMTAERMGVSQTIAGNIANNAEIEIPIVLPATAGDVVIVAPEVVGFADGAGGASVTFARQADPAGTTAADHGYAWARYAENLGWFPRVTGE